MKQKIISIFGWYGVMAILLAYVFLSFGFIEARGYAYQLLNLTGALGIVAEAASKKYKQPAVLNAVWALIALAIIVQLIVPLQ